MAAVVASGALPLRPRKTLAEVREKAADPRSIGADIVFTDPRSRAHVDTGSAVCRPDPQHDIVAESVPEGRGGGFDPAVLWRRGDDVPASCDRERKRRIESF